MILIPPKLISTPTKILNDPLTPHATKIIRLNKSIYKRFSTNLTCFIAVFISFTPELSMRSLSQDKVILYIIEYLDKSQTVYRL